MSICNIPFMHLVVKVLLMSHLCISVVHEIITYTPYYESWVCKHEKIICTQWCKYVTTVTAD